MSEAVASVKTKMKWLVAVMVVMGGIVLILMILDITALVNGAKSSSSPDAVSSSQTALAARVTGLERSAVPSASSCQQYKDKGFRKSGIYFLNLEDGGVPIAVYCDMVSDDHPWLVFQRRDGGSEDFYRTWREYKAGFGRLDTEFWLGNDNLHRLTSAGMTHLRVDLVDWQDNTAYALYSSFSVAGEEDNYRLSVSGYRGTAGDSLAEHDGMAFTTKDADHDRSPANCGESYLGAWWYNKCHRSNLNGKYHVGGNGPFAKGVNWADWNGYSYSLKTTQMKIR